MRLALFFFVLVGMAYAQDSESNMNCVERLQIPLYPPLANAATHQWQRDSYGGCGFRRIFSDEGRGPPSPQSCS